MFDVKALIDKLKLRGLDLAEDATKGVVSDVYDWAKVEAVKVAGPFAGVIALVLEELKKALDVEVDKIDGKVG